MEDFLDIVWMKIVEGIDLAYIFFNRILTPLDMLGPGAAVLVLALVTVCLTKFFNRIYTTKRYEVLKKEFEHWFNLRQEALKCEDPEKGKILARNIDQGKLNRVYYDFFFEGLLKKILTTYLPILIVAAYINEAYKAEHLTEKFGKAYIFQFGGSGGDPVVVGAVFWYVLGILGIYIAWFAVPKLLPDKKK